MFLDIFFLTGIPSRVMAMIEKYKGKKNGGEEVREIRTCKWNSNNCNTVYFSLLA